MDDRDLNVRRLTYATFVELGRAPTIDEIAGVAGLTTTEVAESWRSLHDDHALVLAESTTDLRMVSPFSAVPTPYRIHALGDWYANCAWDAFGICAALHTDGEIEATCLDCGKPIEVAVRDGRPDDESLVFHCLVPARHWWDDIVFT